MSIKKLGVLIKGKREEKKMSMDVLAEKINYSKSYISLLERNKTSTSPGVRFLYEVSKHLNLPFSSLLELSDHQYLVNMVEQYELNKKGVQTISQSKQKLINKIRAIEETKSKFSREIAKYEAEIKFAKHSIREIEGKVKELELEFPNWVEFLVHPIARQLECSLGVSCEVYENFSMEASAIIDCYEGSTNSVAG